MWRAMTGRFGSEELGMLESMPAAELVATLLRSDPLVALRGVAEVMLNGDNVKLTELLKSDELKAHWERYSSDREVDENDHEYARRLAASR